MLDELKIRALHFLVHVVFVHICRGVNVKTEKLVVVLLKKWKSSSRVLCEIQLLKYKTYLAGW